MKRRKKKFLRRLSVNKSAIRFVGFENGVG